MKDLSDNEVYDLINKLAKPIFVLRMAQPDVMASYGETPAMVRSRRTRGRNACDEIEQIIKEFAYNKIASHEWEFDN